MEMTCASHHEGALEVRAGRSVEQSRYLSIMLTSQVIDTPVGTMTAIVSDRGLVLFEFSGPRRLPGQLARVHALFGETPEAGEHAFLNQTRAELDEYFAGRREEFTLPL